MSWLSSNWIWVALVLGFVAFHVLGHRRGGHGYAHRGHDGHTGANDPQGQNDAAAGEAASSGANTPMSGHRRHRHHGC